MHKRRGSALLVTLRGALLALLSPLILFSTSEADSGKWVEVPPEFSPDSPDYFGNWIAYGERAYMDVTVVSRSGLDSKSAIVETKPSRPSAIHRCKVDDETSVLEECVEQELSYAPPSIALTANCQSGEFDEVSIKSKTFTDRMRFIGMSKGGAYYFESADGQEFMADPAHGNLTSYNIALTAWRALCPNTGLKHVLSPKAENEIKMRIEKLNAQ